MSDNIDFARNKNLIVSLARALEASNATTVSELITYLEGASAGFGTAANLDVGTLQGQLAALGVGGKFDASLLPDSAGAVWGGITGSIANQTDLIGGSGKLLTSLIPDEVLSAMRYRGTWNATTNVRSVEGTAMPAASGSNKGHYYKVSVAGSTNLDGITDWAIGDWVISNGSTYDKIDNTDAVVSVAGLTGVVPAATQAQAEAGTATNALMTPQRTAQAIAALAGGGGLPNTKIAFKTDTAQISGPGTWFDTGLSVSISVANAANRVLLEAAVSAGAPQGNSAFFRFVRSDGTVLTQGDTDGGRVRLNFGSEGIRDYALLSLSGMAIDLPGSTGVKTFKLQWRGSSNLIYLNKWAIDTNDPNYPRAVSSLKATEIGPA